MRILNKTSLKFISGFVLIIAVAVMIILFTGIYEAEVNGDNNDLQEAVAVE